MSEVATEECEGCSEERPVQQLQSVTLPSGHTVRCCPECRYHAEKLLDGATRACEGCGETVPATDLQPTPLTDGQTLDLCADCVSEASTIYQSGDASGAQSADQGASAGTTIGDGTGATGASVSSGVDATDAAKGAGTTEDGAGSDGSGSSGSSDSSASDGRGGGDSSSGSDGTAEGGRTGKPATRDHVCDQCGDIFSIELYKVKTVDGRTEDFCPDCKDEGLHDGIVRDVELRRAQAYEVLELDGSADTGEIREAYIRRVKESHPDRSDGSRSEFMLVQQAYERLQSE